MTPVSTPNARSRAVATTIKAQSLPLSRRVEAQPSRSFEARVFARNFGRSREKVAARELRRDQRMPQRNWRKIGTNRSKTAKSFTGVSMCPSNAVVDGLGRHCLIDPVRSCAGLHRYVRFAAAHACCCHPRRPSNWGRERHKERTACKAVLNAAALPSCRATPTSCRSWLLLAEHRSFMQPIHYPMVPLRNGAAADHEKPLTRRRAQRCSPRGPRGCVGKGRECAEALGSGS